MAMMREEVAKGRKEVGEEVRRLFGGSEADAQPQRQPKPSEVRRPNGGPDTNHTQSTTPHLAVGIAHESSDSGQEGHEQEREQDEPAEGVEDEDMQEV